MLKTNTWWTVLAAGFLVSLLFASCSDSKTCGTNQTLDASDNCICVTGTGFEADGKTCSAPGDHQVVLNGVLVCDTGYELDETTEDCVYTCGTYQTANSTNDGCICISGYQTNSSTGECEAVVKGTSCDPAATTPCNSTEFSYCYPLTTTAGYCTKSSCTVAATSTDCGTEVAYTNSGVDEPTFYCRDTTTPTFCEKAPTGVGTACTTGGTECTTLDATFCTAPLTPSNKVCVVKDCSTASHSCYGTRVCCDLPNSGPYAAVPNVCLLPTVANSLKALVTGTVCGL